MTTLLEELTLKDLRKDFPKQGGIKEGGSDLLFTLSLSLAAQQRSCAGKGRLVDAPLSPLLIEFLESYEV